MTQTSINNLMDFVWDFVSENVGFSIDMVHLQLYELGEFHVVYRELYHPISNCEDGDCHSKS